MYITHLTVIGLGSGLSEVTLLFRCCNVKQPLKYYIKTPYKTLVNLAHCVNCNMLYVNNKELKVATL